MRTLARLALAFLFSCILCLLEWGCGRRPHGDAEAPSGGYAFVTAWACEWGGDLATDPDGNVWVVFWHDKSLVKFDPSGRRLAVWPEEEAALAAAPERRDGLPFMPRGDSLLSQPQGVAVDPRGNVYVADTGNHRIVKFDPSGRVIGKWGNTYLHRYTLRTLGRGGEDQLIEQEFSRSGSGEGGFYGPTKVAPDRKGNVFVLDTGNRSIQVRDSAGRFIRQWSCAGAAIAAGPSGDVYVSEVSNGRIYRFDASGRVVQRWGGWGYKEGQFGGDSERAPAGIAVDVAGNVYVADPGNHRVQKFDPSGRFLAKWGSEGSVQGEFRRPEGVAVDRKGNVYVLDSGNGRIQKFAPVR